MSNVVELHSGNPNSRVVDLRHVLIQRPECSQLQDCTTHHLPVGLGRKQIWLRMGSPQILGSQGLSRSEFWRTTQQAIEDALGTPSTCDRALARIFTGHYTDIAFMAGYQLANTYNTHIPPSTASPPTPLENNLAQWYTNQGWTPNTSTASTWQHDLAHLTIRGPPHSPQPQATTPDTAPDPPARHSHKLRVAWRATQ